MWASAYYCFVDGLVMGPSPDWGEGGGSLWWTSPDPAFSPFLPHAAGHYDWGNP